MSLIRLAVLLCDTPIPTVLERHGDYHAIFQELLDSSYPGSGDNAFTLDPYDVVHKQEYPEAPGDYAGILLTGSAADAHADVPWVNKLTAFVAATAESYPSVKLIGICFGHQIVARALGGSCVRNVRWEAGVATVALTALGKRIFGVESVNLQEMHRDHVPDVPLSFHLLGSTPTARNQGMVRYAAAPAGDADEDHRPLSDIHIFTLQGHPEFTESIERLIIDRHAANGTMDKRTVQEGRERATWRHDGVAVTRRVIWGILGVGSEDGSLQGGDS